MIDTRTTLTDPTVSALTSIQARRLIEAAFTAAREQGYRPMAVAVVDGAAQLMALAREDGASALRLDIALGKAAAAVGMGVNSRLLTQRAKDMPAFFGAVAAASTQKFVPQTGAVLVADEGGRVLGAAGASGGSGDEDEQIVIAAIAAIGLKHA